MIRWKIPFATLADEILTINIHASSGTLATVKGAPTPFETSENQDDDILTASRISTGYIRVIDEKNLSGVMPTRTLERPVTLTTASGYLLWQGFIQPQQFGRDMYLDKLSVDFPVVDALGVLKDIEMDYKNHEMKMETFGELIYEAMSIINSNGLSVTSIAFPKEWHYGTNYLGWARLAVNRLNWFKYNNAQNSSDSDAAKYECISYLELLENIARQLGWFVSLSGTSLTFASPSVDDYYMVGLDQLLQYAQGAQIFPIAMTLGTMTLADEQHADVSNTQTTLQGAKSVKVIANSNPMQDLKVGIVVENVDYVRTRDTQDNTKKLHRLIFRSKQQDLKLYAYSMQGQQGGEAILDNLGYDPTREPAYNYYIAAQLTKADLFDEQEITDGTKINYSYSPAIEIDFKIPAVDQETWASYGPEPLVKFSGSNMPPQSDGCLDFYLDLATWTDEIPRNYLTAELKIGDKYWNGLDMRWQTTPVNFRLELDKGAVVTTKTLDMPYENASHYIIPIENTVIGGEVSLTIMATDGFLNPTIGAAEESNLLIKNIALNYCQPDYSTYKETEPSSTYAATSANSYGQNDIEYNLPMATRADDLKNGYGILYFGVDKAQPGTPQYLSTTHSTESALLSKMKAANFRLQQSIEPTVKKIASATPKIGSICQWNSKKYIVLSRSINWRDSTIKIKAGQQS